MRSKTRIVRPPLRRSPRKFPATTSRALPVLLTQDDGGHGKSDDPPKTVFETSSDSGGNGDDNGVGVNAVEKDCNLSPQVGNNGEDDMDSDSLGLGICIRCNVRDELVLVCGEIGCVIAVHDKCMGCNPSFDNLGKFRCPFCEQKWALARVRETRRKVMEARKALSNFLEGGVVVGDKEHKDVRDTGKQRVSACCDKENQPNDREVEDWFRDLDEDRRKGMRGGQSSCCDRDKTGLENEVQPNSCAANGGDNVGSSGEGTRAGINTVKVTITKETSDEACLPEKGGLRTIEEEKEDLEPIDDDIAEDREVMEALYPSEGADRRVSRKDEGMEQDEEDVQPEVFDELEDATDISKTENPNEGADNRESRKDEGMEVDEEEVQPEVSDELEDAVDISKTEYPNEGEDKRVSEKNEGMEDGEEESQTEASDELENANDISETETVMAHPKRIKRRAGKTANVQNARTSNRSSPRLKVAFSRRKAIAKKNNFTLYEKVPTPKKSQESADTFTTGNFPQEKRKRLHWTSKEEEMLREGVQEFTQGAKNLSWKKILEFGRHVFHNTRTPSDLKDKWRTMMAKEGARIKRR